MFFQAFAIYCKNVAMYCKTVEFAMQIQQETLRLWVNQWSRATAATVGRGRTDQVQNMQKRQLENSTERLTKLREVLTRNPNREFGRSRTSLRSPRPRPPFAVTEPWTCTPPPRRAPPRHRQAAPPGRTRVPRPPGPARARGFSSARRSLQVHKQLVEVGAVRVRKEVVTEHRTIEVPVQREEIVIERHAPNGVPSPTPIGPGEEIRIPWRS